MEKLDNAGTIAYALPAHTSGDTKPLDKAIYSPFKSALKNIIIDCSGAFGDGIFDIFDFGSMLSKAFYRTLTRSNIQSDFSGAGLWPLSCENSIKKPLPQSAKNRSVTRVDDIITMLEKKRKRLSKNEYSAIQPVRLKLGFIDSSAGMVLTQPACTRLAQEKEKQNRQKILEKRKKAAEEV